MLHFLYESGKIGLHVPFAKVQPLACQWKQVEALTHHLVFKNVIVKTIIFL